MITKMVRRRAALLFLVGALVAFIQVIPAAGAISGAPPLIGMTYTHSDLLSCDLHGSTGIVAHYSDPGERRLVRTQLAAMRAAGIDSVRFLLWFMTDASNQDWGVVSSAGGKLWEPYRSNLIRFVSDIHAAGFQRLTISFGPEWSNDPIGVYHPDGTIEDHWDPAKLDENWNFIAYVRRLVKPYAPPDTVFDILSEVPPSLYQPQWAIDRLNNYIRAIWTRYAYTFGLGDAVISLIAKDGQGPDRLQRLVDTLRSTGRGIPADFEFHADWTSPEAYNELEAVKQVLTANGLSTPIVVGETSYENPAVADDIVKFEADSGRRVTEVFEWFQTSVGGACPSPPYRADAYISALKHVPPPPPTPSPLRLLPIPTLHASLSAKGVASLRTNSGTSVSELDAGTYYVVLADRDRHAGFHLSGPDLNVSSGKRFVGRRRWKLQIGTFAPYGSTFTYRSNRNHRRTFIVH
jgi:hypothetical protein